MPTVRSRLTVVEDNCELHGSDGGLAFTPTARYANVRGVQDLKRFKLSLSLLILKVTLLLHPFLVGFFDRAISST